MPSSNLVAFILGAGTNVGAALAAKLHENGYRVALGSRNPKVAETGNEAYFEVKVYVQNRQSIESAFDIVVEKLGPVSVVIYNGTFLAASVHIPENNIDFLSLTDEDYQESAAIGLGMFTAARKALSSFRQPVHRDHPKSFIITGNILPFDQYAPPNFYALGVQKTLQARFAATAAKAYEAENIQFYYATLVSETGGIPALSIFVKSGPAHAKVYWDLINNEKQEDWNHQYA
ncbi:hypothetical protein GALMADRAFT_71414 [Galerina marginata CBS 339.88]|uniref:NAD(P)-binding domain-containing protein n=1 Tax=Galerina marginata (strain CBS 339.88) TaxID=685588 RepID=A0A067T4U3_GALM3|nr:hypothetical protein GALMADRAFT_71414 [Galerina marginata CBS 339.88]